MQLIDLNDFLRLSEVLNLQLSISTVGLKNVNSIILHRKQVGEENREILMRVLAYLTEAYGQRRRKIGPLAVLHPLRATALLSRAQEQLNLLGLLTCLLHDKLEDLTPEVIGAKRHAELEAEFQKLLKTIDPRDEWFLMERLGWLTRREGDTYHQYIGRLLDHAGRTPEAVRIKLADRLDNTLDMHVEIEDPIQGVDFFETLFNILYVRAFRGYTPQVPHPMASALNGAQRLYQLFKNAVLLSLVRRRCAQQHDRTTKVLFDGLAQASMKEAQRIVLHIFGYHQTDPRRHKELLVEVMNYSQAGLLDRVTRPEDSHRLDGLFVSRFRDVEPGERIRNLSALYEDKDLMVEAAMAFVIIFQSFMFDPDFCVRGVTEQGLHPA
jgi:hypothetical protein